MKVVKTKFILHASCFSFQKHRKHILKIIFLVYSLSITKCEIKCASLMGKLKLFLIIINIHFFRNCSLLLQNKSLHSVKKLQIKKKDKNTITRTITHVQKKANHFFLMRSRTLHTHELYGTTGLSKITLLYVPPQQSNTTSKITIK